MPPQGRRNYYIRNIKFGGQLSMAKKQEGKKTTTGNIKLQPLGDRVVLEREESESITAGGIVLPDSARTSLHGEKLSRWATAG